MLTVQKNVKIPLCSFFGELVNARRCATTGVGFRQGRPVEVPLLQFVDSRRHPCCGGSDSACGVATVTVISTVVDIPVVAQRQVWETARKPSTFHGCSSQQFFKG